MAYCPFNCHINEDHRLISPLSDHTDIYIYIDNHLHSAFWGIYVGHTYK